MSQERSCEGSSCGIAGCTPCAYLGLFIIIPYSIYLLTGGRLLGAAFLAYGTFIARPLISGILGRLRPSPRGKAPE